MAAANASEMTPTSDGQEMRWSRIQSNWTIDQSIQGSCPVIIKISRSLDKNYADISFDGVTQSHLVGTEKIQNHTYTHTSCEYQDDSKVVFADLLVNTFKMSSLFGAEYDSHNLEGYNLGYAQVQGEKAKLSYDSKQYYKNGNPIEDTAIHCT
jgi:hypothetical protein